MQCDIKKKSTEVNDVRLLLVVCYSVMSACAVAKAVWTAVATMQLLLTDD